MSGAQPLFQPCSERNIPAVLAQLGIGQQRSRQHEETYHMASTTAEKLHSTLMAVDDLPD